MSQGKPYEKAAELGITVVEMPHKYALDVRSEEDVVAGVPCYHCGEVDHAPGCRAVRWVPPPEKERR